MDGASDRIRRIGALAWAGVGVLIFGWALFQLLGFFRPVIPPLLVAVLFVVILHPVVSWLEQRGVRRHLGTALSFALVGGSLTGLLALVAPVVVGQTRQLLTQLPSLLGQYRSGLEGEPGEVVDALAAQLAALAREGDLLGAAQQAFAIAGSLIATAFSVLLGVVIAFYAVADFPRLRSALRSVVPPGARTTVERLIERTLDTTTEFMRVRLILALVVGALGTFGFWLIGLPYWLLLGFVLGATNIIPILGTYLGAFPALVVAFLTLGPMGAFWTLVVIMASAAVDGYFLTPMLMHHHLDLHPIAVILGVVIGGAWYGFWGVLFILPVLAAAKSFTAEYLRLRGYLQDEEDGDGGADLPLPLEEALR